MKQKAEASAPENACVAPDGITFRITIARIGCDRTRRRRDGRT
jgi:hypothetical protein